MLDNNQFTIFIVDDLPENLELLSTLLLPNYRVRAAISGEQALRMINKHSLPDLILLDVVMPGMDGYEVLNHLRAAPNTHDIPVILVTAMDSVDSQLHGLSLGAVDYITKPIVPNLVLARVHLHIELKKARDFLRSQNNWLEKEIAKRMYDNDLIQQVSIRALANLAETRDPDSGNHIMRTQLYVYELALCARHHLRFKAILTDDYINLLTRSAPLHDIGKVGIPDTILHKQSNLLPEEWYVMQTHPMLGAIAIEKAEHNIEKSMDFLYIAKEIVRWHHERWDGNGYPDGLAGEQIPLSARIMALADTFDAMTASKIYKSAIPYHQARDIILAERGKQFDPELVDVFIEKFNIFVGIAERYQENNKLR